MTVDGCAALHPPAGVRCSKSQAVGFSSAARPPLTSPYSDGEKEAHLFTATPRCRSGHCQRTLPFREKGSGSGARGRAFRLIGMWRELAPRSVSVPRLAGHSAAPCTFHGQSPRLLRISLPHMVPFAEPSAGKRRPVVGPSEPRLPIPWREVTAALPDTRCAPGPVRAMGGIVREVLEAWRNGHGYPRGLVTDGDKCVAILRSQPLTS